MQIADSRYVAEVRRLFQRIFSSDRAIRVDYRSKDSDGNPGEVEGTYWL